VVGVSASEKGPSIDRTTRAWLGARVVLATLLALAAAVLATEVADWRYLRWDLSARGRNTIDAATLARVDNLAEDLAIDTFLRPLAGPYRAVSGEALARTVDLLALLENARRGKVAVVHHDMSVPAAALEAQQALGVEGENVLVVSYRGRRGVLRVFGDAAAVDWGNPTKEWASYLTERGIPNVVDPRTWNPDPRAFEPARLEGFYGEAALAAAIARVSIEDAPRVYVSTGHGEPPIDGTLEFAYGRLARELRRDGFRVDPWNGAEGPPPADCDVLAVLGPRQPFAESELLAVLDYVARGGCLLVAPGSEAPGAVIGLLAPHGLELQEGLVCEEIRDERGVLYEGLPQCAVLKIDGRTMAADFPVTELMRRNGLRLEFLNSLSFRRATPAADGPKALVRDLVRSTPSAWRDLRDPVNGGYDFALDQTRGETKGAATLVALVEREAAQGTRGGRVLAIGSALFLSDREFEFNRDFLRAAFNWMVEREERIDVAPRTADTTAIDVERGAQYGVLAWTLSIALPGACALVGAFVWWRRRR
jgi:hypothetical protein